MTIHTLYLQNKGATAREDRQLIEDLFIVERVLDETGLIVTAVGGGSYGISVSPGRCAIKGDTNANQGMYRMFSDVAEARTHVAPVTNPRIDLIGARVYDLTEVLSGPDQGDIEIIQGTPTVGATLANLSGAPGQGGGPVIPASTMPMYYVRVPTTGGLTAADLLDVRPRTKGRSIIATEEVLTNVAYGLMATPDRVPSVVVPADALVYVEFQGMMKNTNNSAGRAAIFIGTNQLKIAADTQAAPVVQEAAGNQALNVYRPISSAAFGLSSSAISDATAYTGDVTTGQVVASHTGAGASGVCVIDNLAAGTYDFSVQWKATAGSVTAKNRRLKVWIVPF